MAEFTIGQRIPSAIDSYYQNYVHFCERLQIAPGDYPAWLRIDRPSRSACVSKAGGRMISQSPQQHSARYKADASSGDGCPESGGAGSAGPFVTLTLPHAQRCDRLR